MGLQWDKPRKVKNDTLLLVSAKLPAEKTPETEELWNLWRMKKEAIKADGFGTGRTSGGYGKQAGWCLNYWHTIDDNTFQKTSDGVSAWQVTFKATCAKWNKMLIDLRKVTGKTIISPDESTQPSEDLLTEDGLVLPPEPKYKSTKLPRAKSTQPPEDLVYEEEGDSYDINDIDDL